MAISQISDQALGKFLKIVFDDGIYNQISDTYPEWDYIQRINAGKAAGRSYRFLIQSSYGPAAIQSAGISPVGNYPAASQISITEAEALYKETNATIELPYNLWNRAKMSPEKYGDVLEAEILSKSIAAKRRMSADLFNDGLGVVGKVSGSPSISGGKLVVTLEANNTSPGFVGWFEYGDFLIHKEPDATAVTDPTLASGTHSYFRVDVVDRVNNQVTLASITTAGAVGTINAAGVKDDDIFYRFGQSTFQDLTSVSGDYNTLTEAQIGLESLTAYDGRTVHGIVMSGSSAGSQYDCSANPLDSVYIQRGLSQCKTSVGQGRYKYRAMIMAPEADDALMEAKEVDRRFMSIDDNKRGGKKFVYVHNNDSVEVVVSEFCPKNRIYFIPEAANGKYVLEYRGSNFEPVRPNNEGSEFFLKPSSSGGHSRNISSYLEAVGILVCKHPKAILRLHNFTV